MKKKSGIIVLVLFIVALVVVCVYKLNVTDGNYRMEFQGKDTSVVEEWETEGESTETVTPEDIEKAYLTPRVENSEEPEDDQSVESAPSQDVDSTEDKSENSAENKNEIEDKSENSTENKNEIEDKSEDSTENENKTEETPEVSEEPSVSDKEKTEYENYMEMSGEEQQKFFESYENPEDFFEWYNAAKAEYDKQNQAVVVEGGSINLEDYIGKKDE